MESIIYNQDIFVPEVAFSTLHEIFTETPRDHQLNSIFDTALSQTIELLDVDIAIIYQFSDVDARHLSACAVQGLARFEINGDLTAADEDYSSYENFVAWVEGQIWPWRDFPVEENFLVKTALGIPIRSSTELLGWLFVARKTKRVFSDLEKTLHLAIASRLAQNLERLAQYRRTLCLEIITEISQMADEQDDSHIFLNDVVSLLQRRFDFYSVNVFLVEPGGKWASCRAAAGKMAEETLFHQPKLAINWSSMIGWAIESGKSSVAYMPWPKKASADARQQVIESELLLCLQLANRVIGVLDINSTEPFAFRHSTEFAAFQSVADHISQTLSRLSKRVIETSAEVPVAL